MPIILIYSHLRLYVDAQVHKKGKVVSVLNQALCHEDVSASECIDPHFLNLSTSWR
jgi:hypothetical protein